MDLINFDRPSGCYGAGEILSGKVKWRPERIGKVENLYLNICGTSEVTWYDDDLRQEFSRKSTTIKESALLYSRASSSSWSSSSSSSSPSPLQFSDHRTHNPRAEVNVPFLFLLNVNLPPSYEDDVARVSYHVGISTEIESGISSSIGAQKYFRVHAELDLNLLPDAFKVPHPVAFKLSSKKKDRPFPIALLLEKRCFIPGEELQILEGFISYGVLRYVQVIKEVTYSGHHKGIIERKTREEEVAKKLHNLVSYSGQPLLALPLDLIPSSRCPCCSLVHIGYRLEVAMEYNAVIYENKVEIIIGTKRLKITDAGLSLEQILEKSLRKEGGRKSSETSTSPFSSSSSSSLPPHFPSPEEEEQQPPDRNDDYFISRARLGHGALERRSGRSQVSSSFKTSIALSMVACLLLPPLGLPAVFFALISKKSEANKEPRRFLKISYGLSIASLLICLVVASAAPGLLIGATSESL